MKLTTTGREKFLTSGFDFTDSSNFMFKYLDNSVLTITEALTIGDGWTGVANDTGKLANQNAFGFQNFNATWDGVSIPSLVFYSEPVVLSSGFTKPTGGFAVVLNPAGDECYAIINVIAEALDIVNTPDLVQGWSDNELGRITFPYLKYNANMLSLIVDGTLDITTLKMTIYQWSSNIIGFSSLLAATTRTEIDNIAQIIDTIVQNEDIDNFREVNNYEMFIFDSFYISFLPNDNEVEHLLVSLEAPHPTTGEILPVVVTDDIIGVARGGVFLSPGTDGFFNINLDS